MFTVLGTRRSYDLVSICTLESFSGRAISVTLQKERFISHSLPAVVDLCRVMHTYGRESPSYEQHCSQSQRRNI